MAETKKKDAGGHGKSTYFQTAQYKQDQQWRKNFRAHAEMGMSDPYIRDFCRQHGYKQKGDYSGIILRKRGWIQVRPGYASVYCCGTDTDNNAQNLVFILTMLVVLWIFYVCWALATLTLWNEFGHDYLWFGAAVLTLNFMIIMVVVIKGYQQSGRDYAKMMEEHKKKEEEENKSHQI